jgi:hypothetical protein
MKKLLLLSFVFQLLVLNADAQIQVESQVDKTEFPLVEFVLNDRNPEVSTLNDFQFFEIIADVKVETDSLTFDLIEDTVDYSAENKCVLIMIEALHQNYRYDQVNTFLQAVENSIDAIVNDGDKVMIVAFSLSDETTVMLENVTSKFTDNKSEIKRKLDSYKVERNVFTNHNVSNIMLALNEGIELLVDQENSLPKFILLLSEEYTNSYDQLTAHDITERAKSKDIVINTVKYNRRGYHQHKLPTLSKETYGVSKALISSIATLKNVNSTKAKEAEDVIVGILDNCIERASGNKYLVNISVSNVIKDGVSREIEIKQIDSEHKCSFSYNAPGNWIIAQFQKNLILAIGISLLLLLLLVYLVYWFVSRKKKNRILLEQDKRRQRKIDKEQEAEILKQKEALLIMKNKEEQRINSEQLTKQNILKAEDEKELILQMKRLGAFPILKYTDSSNTDQFEINKPLISVGRDVKTNVITIPNSNISRNHFSITFSNNKYSVVDNNSTNGMIINGYKLKKAELKNGDIIEIADVTFTFYL